MAEVEERRAATSLTVADVQAQVQTILVGLTKSTDHSRGVADQADKAMVQANKAIEQANKAIETADKAIASLDRNTKECHELRATTEKISSTQDHMLTSITNVEKSLEGLGARLTTLEGSSSVSTQRIPGPNGHGAAHAIQDTAHEHVLANGAYTVPQNQFESGPSNHALAYASDKHRARTDRYETDGGRDFRMPKTNFPKFDGTNPKIWKEKYEKYFHMFTVPDELKADYATLHFTGTVAFWLQTYEAQHDVPSWVALCVAVCNKFGKDLYYTHMNQTLEVKQNSDVDSYYREFELLMHQLLSHNPALDDTFFVTKFMKGLKKEIRSAILLHKPRTVDAAISLSLLQESQMADERKANYQRYEPKEWHNTAGKGCLGVHPAEATTGKDKAVDVTPPVINKLDNLKAQRRARGECFKCGGPFAPGHKCPRNIALAVMEQLCEALQIEQDPEQAIPDDDAESDSGPDEEQIMCLCAAAVSATQPKRTIRLLGHIGQRQILIDSGSSSNFISEDLATALQVDLVAVPSALVTIANGAKLSSTKGITALKWGVQNHRFETDVRLLPLGCYDMVLGIPWLESQNNGKMSVNWRLKTLRFKHHGTRITLRGVKDNTTHCPRVSAKELKKLVQQDTMAQLVQLSMTGEVTPTMKIPAQIQAVIDTNAELFKEPTKLPPHKSFDHQIPLIHDAVPVVHVSLLKQAIPANALAKPDSPAQCMDATAGMVPLNIMDTKELHDGATVLPMVQVQWSSLPSHRLTWENK